MATKVYLDPTGVTIIVDNGTAQSNIINVDNFFFEKNDSTQEVTLRDVNDDYKLRSQSSEIQDQGGVPIGTYQDVVDFLTSLVAIGSTVGGATEATLLMILGAIQDGQDYEAKLVVDSDVPEVTWLEVRIWNPDTQTWEAPTYYAAGSNTPGTPVLPISYINPSDLLAQIAANTTGINLEVTQLLIKTAIDSIKTNTDNLDVALSTRATEATQLLIEANTDAVKTGLTAGVVTHNTVVAVAAGSIASSLSGSVLNSGDADGTWNGATVPAGVSISWDPNGNRDLYAAINYDASGTTFIIEYTT